MKPVTYIGCDDAELDLFESQYELPEGMCYNSYLLVGEKIAIMDSVDPRKTDEWLEKLAAALEGRKPDYLIVQHMEPDHSGSIRAFREAYPQTEILASEKALLFMQQFNVAIAGIILLSYYFVEKERDEYATLFIVIGTLVKIYGIVGLAFFFFSRHKTRYILSLILWSVLLFCLPMLISSPEYQLQEYREWIECLGGKNGENVLSRAQNISLLGLVRKIGYACSVGHTAFMSATAGDIPIDMNNWWMRRYSDIWLIASGMAVMANGYFRISQWKNRAFRETILAAVLMFVCLFSTGTESSGYIIAIIGCVIWYCCAPWRRSKADIALLVLVFIVTSMSPSDLFPRYIRQEFIQPYALKALPVALIWMKLCEELRTKDYRG